MVIALDALQLSDTVAKLLKSGNTAKHPAPKDTVWLAGQVIVGALPSTTTTLDVHVPNVPQADVIVKVTVVVPTG
jgi:hypothetical protein